MERLQEVLISRRTQLDGTYSELLSRGEKPEFAITSLPKLNVTLWGLRKGLTVIGARTSQGKSALLGQITLDLVKNNVPTLFLSLEMTVESMIERMFCYECSINNYDLRAGRFAISRDMKEKYSQFAEKFAKYPLQLVLGFGKDLKELIHIVKQDWRPKLKCVCLDYIGMIRGGDKERERLQEYIREFRHLMLEEGMCGIIASQVNRTTQETDNRPNLSQLKSTGALEEVSDTVLLLNWPYFYTRKEESKKDFEIYIAKNRFGATGMHKVYYEPKYYQFTEISDDDPVVVSAVKKTFTQAKGYYDKD